MVRLLPILAAALIMTGLAMTGLPAAATAQTRATPVQRDWTRTVVATPEGGLRMGNPAARVKLVEYLSLTCPHCAAFAAESEAALVRNYVRRGSVSLEYRNYLLNLPDLAAAVVARCAAPAQAFAMSQELLRTQATWLAPASTMSAADFQRLQALTPLQAVQRLAPLLGLNRIGARHGLTTAAYNACIARQANVDRLANVARTAESQYSVTGTPTFVMNGQVLEVNRWPDIEALIRRAGG